MHMQAQQTVSPLRRWNDTRGIRSHERPDPVVPDRLPAHFRRDHEAFEIRNVSGKTARGIEIEVTGFGEEDVFQAYYLSRYGAPGVSRTPGALRVCFESHCRMPAQALSHSTTVRARASTRASQPFVWELALFGGSGSDRFCLELSTLNVVATYRWLIATDESVETLVADDAPAHVHDAREYG